jgi:nicotinamide-nucleotide amidase
VQIELVTIGDELILGFTVDTNAAHIARTLAAEGFTIARRTTVGDDRDAIAQVIREALVRCDGVITTGGLGPTSDDVSAAAAAELFRRPLVLDEATFDRIRERWAQRGFGPVPDNLANQAMVPAGATLLVNSHGAAPGIWMEDPRGRWLAMLPGVPREMRGMLADVLVPRLRELQASRGGASVVVASRTVRTTGVAESRIAERVAGVNLSTNASLAFLPSWEGVDLRVTMRNVSPEAAERGLAESVQALRALVRDVAYGEDDDDLAAIVLDLLRARGWKAAVAESCTGGMLGMRLTATPGSSEVFVGGTIAYDNRVKVAALGVSEATLASDGAVSDAVALQMARGARERLGANVAFGITGVAGPDGGTPAKPVGTVSLAVDIAGESDSRTVRLIGDRDEIRRRATQAALMMAWRRLS